MDRNIEIGNFTTHKVVSNDEQQYSIWPARHVNPAGWHDTGIEGSTDDCLAYIREIWTDMVPLSLSRKMDLASYRLVEAMVETALRENLFFALSGKACPATVRIRCGSKPCRSGED